MTVRNFKEIVEKSKDTTIQEAILKLEYLNNDFYSLARNYPDYSKVLYTLADNLTKIKKELIKIEKEVSSKSPKADWSKFK